MRLREFENVGGYCKQCGRALDISSRCVLCITANFDIDVLRAVLYCYICGEPMIHSPLRGYHCWNKAHNRQIQGE